MIKQAGQRQVYAVRGRTVDAVNGILLTPHSQRRLERQGIARTAAIPVRRHNGDIGEFRKSFGKDPDPTGTIAVIVANQDFQFGLTFVHDACGGYI